MRRAPRDMRCEGDAASRIHAARLGNSHPYSMEGLSTGVSGVTRSARSRRVPHVPGWTAGTPKAVDLRVRCALARALDWMAELKPCPASRCTERTLATRKLQPQMPAPSPANPRKAARAQLRADIPTAGRRLRCLPRRPKPQEASIVASVSISKIGTQCSFDFEGAKMFSDIRQVSRNDIRSGKSRGLG